LTTIRERVRVLFSELPDDVRLVAAAKGRTPLEVQEAVDAGVSTIGENYIKDARAARELIGSRATWHFIGRLRPHDVRVSSLNLFDMVESVSSLELAKRMDEKLMTLGRNMPVLVEVNSGREPQKAGVWPEQAEALVRQIATLSSLEVVGLMTMGPLMVGREFYRPCFAETHQLFLTLKKMEIPRVSMDILSMGTSDSYEVAIEEGSNMVRLGTTLFGPR